MTISISFSPIRSDAQHRDHGVAAGEAVDFETRLKTQAPAGAPGGVQTVAIMLSPLPAAQLQAAQLQAAQQQPAQPQANMSAAYAPVPPVSGLGPLVPSQMHAPVGAPQQQQADLAAFRALPLGPLVASQMQQRPTLQGAMAMGGPHARDVLAAPSDRAPLGLQARALEEAASGRSLAENVRGVMESAIGRNGARLEAHPANVMAGGIRGERLTDALTASAAPFAPMATGGMSGGLAPVEVAARRLADNVRNLMESAVARNSARLEAHPAQVMTPAGDARGEQLAQAGSLPTAPTPGGSDAFARVDAAAPLLAQNVQDVMGAAVANNRARLEIRLAPAAIPAGSASDHGVPEGLGGPSAASRPGLDIRQSHGANIAQVAALLNQSLAATQRDRPVQATVDNEIAQSRLQRHFPDQLREMLEAGKSELHLGDAARIYLLDALEKDGVIDPEAQLKMLEDADRQMKDSYQKILDDYTNSMGLKDTPQA